MRSLALAAAGSEPQVHLTSQTRIVAAVIAVVFMLLILELRNIHVLRVLDARRYQSRVRDDYAPPGPPRRRPPPPP